MNFAKTENGYIIRLIKGEKIVETLTSFCHDHNITAGSLTGIGGASDTQLGYYNLEQKTYLWKTFSQIHEIISMTGNIAMVDNEPFLHIHTTISDKNYQCFGGHLKEAITGATLEVMINTFDTTLTREFDDEIRLKLLSLSNE